ncbi:MAG: hypothetical protein E6K94_11460 [Thaumarchaeota archaeon]|nr:MAG: hypothetical protein E6K94_11460 [Nitrososphaerota archaeon]
MSSISFSFSRSDILVYDPALKASGITEDPTSPLTSLMLRYLKSTSLSVTQSAPNRLNLS